MTAPATAQALYDEQSRIIRAAVAAAMSIWGGVDPTRFSASWVQSQIGEQLFVSVSRAQELAAMAADVYTDLILLDQGIEVDADGEIVPRSLAGVASDGRPLESLLVQPLIQASVAGASGATLQEAMSAGAAVLTRIVGTQVADAGRSASGLGIAARPRTGFVRLVEPKACSRCIILAGRWYHWSSGFARHPLCKCRNIPASEDTPMLDAASDPMTHFNSLSETEQNRQFTVAGARAIRDGADINKVVNARRGALGLDVPGRLTAAERQAGQRKGDKYRQLQRTDVYGRPINITLEGTTYRAEWGREQLDRYGGTKGDSRYLVAKVPRLMPEAIFEIATDRADAVRLLRRFGYMK